MKDIIDISICIIKKANYCYNIKKIITNIYCMTCIILHILYLILPCDVSSITISIFLKKKYEVLGSEMVSLRY